jgi:hypothetical protein
MLSSDTRSAPTAGGLPRQVEFAGALDRYITSYIAEQRRQIRRPIERAPNLRLIDSADAGARRVGAFIVDALESLGSAMSAGGRFPFAWPM